MTVRARIDTVRAHFYFLNAFYDIVHVKEGEHLERKRKDQIYLLAEHKILSQYAQAGKP